jgi:hypothetical protein
VEIPKDRFKMKISRTTFTPKKIIRIQFYFLVINIHEMVSPILRLFYGENTENHEDLTGTTT